MCRSRDLGVVSASAVEGRIVGRVRMKCDPHGWMNFTNVTRKQNSRRNSRYAGTLSVLRSSRL